MTLEITNDGVRGPWETVIGLLPLKRSTQQTNEAKEVTL